MDNTQCLVSFIDLNIENLDFTALKDSPSIPTQQLAFTIHKIANSKIVFKLLIS